MANFDHFETELHSRYPKHQLFIRNMCDEGNTPGFRPHSARKSPWAFPGAEKFRPLSNARDRWGSGNVGNGFYKSPDEWLATLKPDLIIGFFGYCESFGGPQNLESFKAELAGLIKHTAATTYNGKKPSRFVLVSPTAFQNLSTLHGTPNGIEQNINLALYTNAMKEIAKEHEVPFIDVFTPTKQWFEKDATPLTRDGALLTSSGYARLAPLLAESLFGKNKPQPDLDTMALRKAISEKSWLWRNYYKIPNGVHVFGRRHRPYGPKNYPAELTKLAEMMHIRDKAVWAAPSAGLIDIAKADAQTSPLPNFGEPKKTYLPAKGTAKKIKVPEGYGIGLFASNEQFPDLANPVQLSFDNKGRLWVATMPSYPHYKPGDAKPNDKLLILEDTDNDGRADKQTIFADGLHLPMGFEFGTDGVYVSQGYSLVYLRDTDGDDRADETEIVLSGFDDHDTHHAISGFCADPSGAIYMGEGTFLHSNVETAYGTIRSSNGGFFRYNPSRRHLERSVRLSIPNPWGIAFDKWGQDFFADTSDPNMRWMLPGSVRVGYGNFAPNPPNLLEVKVRPTSGLEIVSSRHFPDEVQGDILINNTIGFLGTKQHTLTDDGTGFKSTFRQDLVHGSDPNFRPVDMEFAPDGSLYLVDWHNALIGHMQHSARDPDRDHQHGRVFRITYLDRPLVEPAKIHGAPIATLLENLKLPEYRTRYRTRRELRGRDTDEVISAINKWTAENQDNEHLLLEALWVAWGLDRVNETEDLLKTLLAAKDFHARAAAVRVLRYSGHQIPDQVNLLKTAASDKHGRVRMEAIAAASWLGKEEGLAVLAATPVAKPSEEKPSPVTATLDKRRVLHIPAPSTKIDTITIFIPGSGKTLNLSEVEIISGKKNIASKAKATQSSKYDDVFIAELLTDGDKKTFAHSKQNDHNPSFIFTFKNPVKIDSVRIYNRTGYEKRFDDGQISFSLSGEPLLTIKAKVKAQSNDSSSWLDPVYTTAKAYLEGKTIEAESAPEYTTHLKGPDKVIFAKGAEVFNREGHCITCHQSDGKGLPAAQFPPIAGSEWITGSEERLIKLTLHGLQGPIKVNGTHYPGVVPMTPFKMLSDEEISAVLTFVRNTFGNKASVITPTSVKKVREETKSQPGFYSAADLLKEHPE
jgi:mono/diheme cytochrome c family protein/glucose/arabinose dehydrogenase